MIADNTDKLQKSRDSFMKRFTFEKFKGIAKYRNCNRDDYLKYIEKIESLAVLLLESYIFEQSQTL